MGSSVVISLIKMFAVCLVAIKDLREGLLEDCLDSTEESKEMCLLLLFVAAADFPVVDMLVSIGELNVDSLENCLLECSS